MSDEVSGFLQDCPPTPEGPERAGGVAAEGLQLLACARNAEQGDESRLIRARILAGGLAHVLGATLCVQEVVPNPERKPNRTSIGPQRPALDCCGAAQDRSCVHSVLDQRSGLEGLHSPYAIHILEDPLRVQIEHLAADHAAPAGGSC